MKKLRYLLPLLLFVGLATTSCEEDMTEGTTDGTEQNDSDTENENDTDTENNNDDEQESSTVKVTIEIPEDMTKTIFEIAEKTYTLTATVAVDNESVEADVTWSSTDPDVVDITDDGVITFVGIGTATITAIYDGVSSSGLIFTVKGATVSVDDATTDTIPTNELFNE